MDNNIFIIQGAVINITESLTCDIYHRPINPYLIMHLIISLIGAFLLNLSRMTTQCDITHAYRPFGREYVMLDWYQTSQSGPIIE